MLNPRRVLLGASVLGLLALPVAVPAGTAQAAATGDGDTWRASISSTGQQGAFGSTRARISQDGRHVAYLTKSELVPGDTNLLDIYWTDMTDPSHPITKRVSTSYTGGAANGQAEFVDLSADGSKVVYSTLATNAMQGVGSGAFLRDMNIAEPCAGNQADRSGRFPARRVGRWPLRRLQHAQPHRHLCQGHADRAHAGGDTLVGLGG